MEKFECVSNKDVGPNFEWWAQQIFHIFCSGYIYGGNGDYAHKVNSFEQVPLKQLITLLVLT